MNDYPTETCSTHIKVGNSYEECHDKCGDLLDKDMCYKCWYLENGIQLKQRPLSLCCCE